MTSDRCASERHDRSAAVVFTSTGVTLHTVPGFVPKVVYPWYYNQSIMLLAMHVETDSGLRSLYVYRMLNSIFELLRLLGGH